MKKKTKETLENDSAPSVPIVKKWIAVSLGRITTNNAESSGCLKAVVTPEIVNNINKTVLDGRRIKVRKVAEA